MNRVLILIAVFFLLSLDLYAECTKDTDCKGNRICEDEECVYPEKEDIVEVKQPKKAKKEVEDEQVKRKSKFVIGLDTTLFSYNKVKRTIKEDYSDDSSDSYDNYSTSLGGADFGLRLGGAIKEMFIVGSYLGFSFDYAEQFEIKNFGFRFSPFFEVSFLKSRVRPFLRFMFDVYLEKQVMAGNSFIDKIDTFAWLLGGTFSGGLHFFATESFSIDVDFNVGYAGGESEDNDITRFKTGFILGFTGWI